jgi:hypothetical protein
MKNYYAMVVHRALVGGELTGSLDVSAYFYRAGSEADVRARIEAQAPHAYVGGGGEDVKWDLVRIMSIDECPELTSGDEVTGFIASADELGTLVKQADADGRRFAAPLIGKALAGPS